MAGLVLGRFIQMRNKSLAFSDGEHPNIKAFKQAIRHGEGTLGMDGYRRRFGGSLIDVTNGWSHPLNVIKKGKYISSATGVAQFLSSTWLGLKLKLGLADFSPANQELAFTELLRECKALDLIVAGKIQSAVNKCNKTWASMPGSPYGQPVVTLNQFLNYYKSAGGTLA